MIRSCAMVLAAFFTVSLTAFAQDSKGPLAEMPSKPGAHIEKIKAMGNTCYQRRRLGESIKEMK